MDFSEMIPDRTSFLSNFTQRFRGEPFGIDVLKPNENWKVFIPNENSGPCYTYTPPVDSDPGDTNSMYMVFNLTEWDPLLEIFLHEKNDFFYSKRRMLNTKLITSKMLNDSQTKYPRALGNSLLKLIFEIRIISICYMIILLLNLKLTINSYISQNLNRKEIVHQKNAMQRRSELQLFQLY